MMPIAGLVLDAAPPAEAIPLLLLPVLLIVLLVLYIHAIRATLRAEDRRKEESEIRGDAPPPTELEETDDAEEKDRHKVQAKKE